VRKKEKFLLLDDESGVQERELSHDDVLAKIVSHKGRDLHSS